MFVAKSKGRFSPLLLAEGEYYFDDHSARYYPPASSLEDSFRSKREGRLKLCSHSLIFVPDAPTFPIIRLPYSATQLFERVEGEARGLWGKEEVFVVKSSLCVEMRESNKNAPYAFKEAPGEHRFSLKFEPLQSFLPRARHLHSIVTQFPAFQAEAIMTEVIDKREQSITFDPSWLVNLSERILVETKVHKITPLVSTPARIMLTDARLYLQPLNNIDPEPVQKYPFHTFVSIYKRRHTLRHTGLEILMQNDASLFLSFKTRQERDHIYDLLISQEEMKNLQKDDDPIRLYTRKWQEGELSNYDYLMLLNHRAGRTVNDITQYPVFPWIIADYQSNTLDLTDPRTFRDLNKPIGALNSRRLEGFKERYRDMPDPKFLYGTHYSTPGYVLYYLVRAAPEYMLRLQNGKFDAPDRMFHSIADTWNNALNLPADVKELIPEFYNMPDFLLNLENLYLGVRSNGDMLGDVELPPWASSPKDFATKMRQALESDYVSENLHKWIDLIFGYKQRGAEAIAADNVFYHLTYEGAVDIEKVTDPVERLALEAQIAEFGQTPHQLFIAPHPARYSKVAHFRLLIVQDEDLSPILLERPLNGANTAADDLAPKNGDNLPTSTVTPPRPLLSSLFSTFSASFSGTSLRSTGSSPHKTLPSMMRSVSGTLPITSNNSSYGSLLSPTSPSRPFAQTSVSSSAGWEWEEVLSPSPVGMSPSLVDSSPALEAIKKEELLVPVEALSFHDEEEIPVEVIALSPSLERGPMRSPARSPSVGERATSTSWDNLLELPTHSSHRLHRDGISSVCVSTKDNRVYSVSQDGTLKVYDMREERQLRSTQISDLALSSCCLHKNDTAVMLGSWDNNIYVYSVDYGRVVDSVLAHDDALSCMDMSDDVLVSGSWDSTLKVWKVLPSGIDKVAIADFVDNDSEINCVAIHSHLIASGAADGTVMLWDHRSGQVVGQHQTKGPAKALQFTPDGKKLVLSTESGDLTVLQLDGTVFLSHRLEDPARCIATDGRRVVLGTTGGYVTVVHLSSGSEAARYSASRTKAVNCLAVPTDASRIVAGCEDSYLHIWSC